MPLFQLQAGLYDSVSSPTRREGLVRKLRDEPAPAKLLGDVLRRAARLDQLEIAEGAFEHVLWRIEAPRGKITGDNGIARVEAHLHGEQRRSLGMRLHGAAALSIGDREGVDQGGLIEPHELTQRCRAAERTRRRRS